MTTLILDRISESVAQWQQPILRQSANSFEQISILEARMNQSKKVLLVIEDNLWVQEILYAMLCSEYQLIIRSNGSDGIQAFEAIGDSLYAILTDVEMPIMNGDAVIDWVCSKKPDFPILLMSNGLERMDINRLLTKNNVQLLKKPFHKTEVLHKLSRVRVQSQKAA